MQQINTPLVNPYLPIIQARMLDLLRKGIIPWRQGFSPYGPARTYLDNRYLTGISWLLCNFTTSYALPYYLTWNQVQQLGGQIKKDSKAEFIYYQKVGRLLRFPVYNITCVKGIKTSFVKCNTPPPTIYSKIDKWITPLLHIIPTVPSLQRLPQWDAAKEVIKLPVTKKPSSTYYWHLFKAIIAWTGSPDALNRLTLSDLLVHYPTAFQQEQLVCELGAAYLCGYFGVYEPWDIENRQGELVDWYYLINQYPDILICSVFKMKIILEFIFKNTKIITKNRSVTMIL